MFKTAKELKVNFTAIKLSKEMKDQMPAWHHLGLTPKNYRKKQSDCIVNIHSLERVIDLMKLARYTKDPNSKNQKHHPICTCTYNPCKKDRLKGCRNPNKCSKTAFNILRDMKPKYNPYDELPTDDLILTYRRIEKNNSNRKQNTSGILFDPSVTLRNNLADGVRIFTNPERISHNPAL